MTTTIDTVFPGRPDAPADASPAYVDVAPGDVPEGATVYKHSDPAVRRRSFTRNVGDALALLETYRRRHPRMVTSRLHCYLPVRAIGTPAQLSLGTGSRYIGSRSIPVVTRTRRPSGQAVRA